jgi:hypothetical protein
LYPEESKNSANKGKHAKYKEQNHTHEAIPTHNKKHKSLSNRIVETLFSLKNTENTQKRKRNHIRTRKAKNGKR